MGTKRWVLSLPSLDPRFSPVFGLRWRQSTLTVSRPDNRIKSTRCAALSQRVPLQPDSTGGMLVHEPTALSECVPLTAVQPSINCAECAVIPFSHRGQAAQ